MGTMSQLLNIGKCPTCGSSRIRRVRGRWSGRGGSGVITVPKLEYYACPACGERVYDREAMRRIEAHSKRRRPRRTRQAGP